MENPDASLHTTLSVVLPICINLSSLQCLGSIRDVKLKNLSVGCNATYCPAEIL